VNTPRGLLNKKQAAAQLGICADTLLTLTGKGDIVGFKVGGQWRYDQRDIDHYIDCQRQQATQRMLARNAKNQTHRSKPDRGIVSVWLPGMKLKDIGL
jgi:hypothetical protein